MNKIKKAAVLIILANISLSLGALEIDQLTDREKYADNAVDFTDELNLYTNNLIINAVDNYNIQYSSIKLPESYVHKLLAYEIYLVTAGNWTNLYGEIIPDEINLAYAIRKIGLGPIQQWIERDENRTYQHRLKNNIYAELYPPALNKNCIIKVAGEFIGPDKIDHFFDQGYSYWVISDCGRNDKKAREFGVNSEFNWYGFLSGGIFSFGDLRANWAGYQFYKNLLNGEAPLLDTTEDGTVIITRPFDWSEYIDWQFDELKNPSMYTVPVMKQITAHIKRNMDEYTKTFSFLKERDFSRYFDKRENYYLTDDLEFDPSIYFDAAKLISDF